MVQTSILLFPGPGKSKMVQTSNLLFPGPGKSKMVQAGKKQNGSDFQFAFSRPGKSKMQGFQFGKQSVGADCFLRPGNKQRL